MLTQETLGYKDLAEAWNARLKSSPDAIGYLQQRLPGVDIPFYIDLFTLGLSPISWSKAGYFVDRITFPLWSDTSVEGFRGKEYRGSTSRPKGVPWPGTVGHSSYPFGLCPKTRPSFERFRFCVLVEGELDALALWGCGVPAVASCMMSLSRPQALKLSRVVDNVLVWADNDMKPDGSNPGLVGAIKSIDLLDTLGVNAHLLAPRLLGCKDATDVVAIYGQGAVTSLVQEGIEQHIGER